MAVVQIRRKGRADISPVSLHWPNGIRVKAGDLKADQEYIYTFDQDGNSFTIVKATEESNDKDNLA